MGVLRKAQKDTEAVKMRTCKPLYIYVATHMPIAKQRMDEHLPAETFRVNRPLLGKAYNNTRQQ
jgi:hypothetical protein